MALHTGAAEVSGGDYVGSCLNRVGRLLGVGHGGQVLVSQASADLARGALPADAWLEDLGAHRLRDLVQPEHIFQLRHPDLPATFPPLKSLDAYAHNLPIQITSFVGREREIAEVKQRLAATRLLTLTGAGGCGKTRLALQVAADLLDAYPDGVWLVELAPLVDAALVPDSAAAAVRVRGVAGQPILPVLLAFLRARCVLMVLDNCEHVTDACAHLISVLSRQCANVRVLATSREALGLTGEVVWRVPSLSVPSASAEFAPVAVADYEATRLFVERARLVDPEFGVTSENAPAVAEICRRLDGLPLAIELAAARAKALTVEQVAGRLEDRFRLLTSRDPTAPSRQRTLRGAIDWSYTLLPPAEQVLFSRLAVFAGDFSVEAAEDVCADGRARREDVLDLLASLVDKSLIVADTHHGPVVSYRLLETLRQYGREKLAERGEADVWDRAARYLVQAADAASARFDHSRARIEYTQALDALAHLPDTDETRRRRCDTLYRLVLVSIVADPPETNLARLTEAEVLARTLADPSGATGGDRVRLARLLPFLGRLYSYRNEYPKALAYNRQALALATELGNQDLLSVSAGAVGRLLILQGHYDQGLPYLSQAAELLSQTGNWPEWISAVGYRGIALAARGEYSAGLAEVGRARTHAEAIKNLSGLVGVQIFLGMCYGYGGDLANAVASFRTAIHLAEQSGDRLYWYIGSGLCAWAEARAEDFTAAKAHVAAARQVMDSLGGHALVGDFFVMVDADIHRATGDLPSAFALAEQALGEARAIGHINAEGLTHRVWAQALMASPSGASMSEAGGTDDRWQEAAAHLAESARLLESGGNRLEAARTHEVWGRLLLDRSDRASARAHLEKAAAQWETSGLSAELERTRGYLVELG